MALISKIHFILSHILFSDRDSSWLGTVSVIYLCILLFVSGGKGLLSFLWSAERQGKDLFVLFSSLKKV